MFSSLVPVLILIVWILRWLGSRSGTEGGPRPSASPQPTRVTVHVLPVLLFWLPVSVLLVDAGLGWLEIEPSGVYFLALVVLFLTGLWLPHWLGWRVLGPLGWRRAGYWAVVLAPRLSMRHHVGSVETYIAAFGVGRPRPDRWWGDAWSIFTLAVRARGDGAEERLHLIAGFLDRYPRQRVPRRLRTQGWELLAWPAVDRGHWEEAWSLLQSGEGRGVRFLRALVAAGRGESELGWSGRARLWCLWSFAPYRRRSLSAVQRASRRACGRSQPEAVQPTAAVEPWVASSGTAATSTVPIGRRHLEALQAVARGEVLTGSWLVALARGWDEVLRAETQAEFIRRGLELGVPHPSQRAEEWAAEIRHDLDTLLQVAIAPWPEVVPEGALTDYVLRHRVDPLLDALRPVVEPWRIGADIGRRAAPTLRELEAWLELRVAVDRLDHLAGDEGLATSWHEGLRYAACNWPVFLMRARDDLTTNWVCREMFEWCAHLAERVGDPEILELTLGNLESLAER